MRREIGEKKANGEGRRKIHCFNYVLSISSTFIFISFILPVFIFVFLLCFLFLQVHYSFFFFHHVISLVVPSSFFINFLHRRIRSFVHFSFQLFISFVSSCIFLYFATFFRFPLLFFIPRPSILLLIFIIIFIFISFH